MTRFTLLFSSIITACGEEEKDTGETEVNQNVDSVSYEYECDNLSNWCESGNSNFTIDAERFKESLNVQDQLDADSCMALCEEEIQALNGYYEALCSCSYDGNNTQGDALISCNYYTDCVMEGRAYAGIKRALNAMGRDISAAWIARAVHAEMTSVHAFMHLHSELGRHNAPAELRQECIHAARDEIRHTRMMGELAERFGGKVPVLEKIKICERSLLELALENAVEGCVNESYAALIALYQSKHAENHSMRRIFLEIAEDEIRHAELAWKIHEWCIGRLKPEEKSMVLKAQTQAFERLSQMANEQYIGTNRKLLGLPESDIALRLAAQFKEKIAA